jgi:hypothetical protein
MPTCFIDIHFNIYVTPLLGNKFKRSSLETVIEKHYHLIF